MTNREVSDLLGDLETRERARELLRGSDSFFLFCNGESGLEYIAVGMDEYHSFYLSQAVRMHAQGLFSAEGYDEEDD